jgi:hypothetical protein
VDLLFDEGRGLRLNASAFNNEFFAKACQEWRERLIRGDFTPEAIQKNRSDYDSDRRRLDPWKVRHFEPLWGLKRVYDLNNIIPEVGELDWVDRVNKVDSGENRTPGSVASASCGQSDNTLEGNICVDSHTADSASNSIESNKPVLGKRIKIEEDPPVSSSVSPGEEKCRQTLMVSPTKSPRVTVTDTTEEITDLLLVSGEPSATKRRRLDLAESEPSVTTAEEAVPSVEECKVVAVDNLDRGSEPIVPSSEESVCTVLDSGQECEMDSLIKETDESESPKNKEGVIEIEENKRSPLLVEDKTDENSSEEGAGDGELGCDTWADKEINLMDTGTGSKELLQNNDSDDSDNKRGNEVAPRDCMLETKDDGLHQLPINASLSAKTSEHGLASVDTDPENCDKPEKNTPMLPLSPASGNPSPPSQSAYSPKQINSRQSSSEDSIPAPVLTSEEPLCMMFDIEDRAPSSMESTLPPTLSPNCEPEMLFVEEEEETDSIEKVNECVEAVSPEHENRPQSPPLKEEAGPVGEKQDIASGRCDIELTDEQLDEKKPSVTAAASEISEGSYGGELAVENVDSCEEESSCSDYGETEDVGAPSPAQQQVLNGPEEEGSHTTASDNSRCDSSRSGSSLSVAAAGTAMDESENIGETETEEGEKEMEVAGGEGNSCETVSEAGEGGNETTAGAVAEGVCRQVQLETSPIPGSESPLAAEAEVATAAAATAATATAAAATAVPAVLLPEAENVTSQPLPHNDGVGSLLSSITEDGSGPAANFAEDSGSQPSEPANGIISLNSRPSVSLTFYLFKMWLLIQLSRGEVASMEYGTQGFGSALI